MDAPVIPSQIPGSPTAGRKLRVVLAGAGRQGQNLARGFQASVGWDVQAVCDVEIQRARRVASSIGGIPAFRSLNETLDRIRPDAVAIATPLETRRGVVMNALRAGSHVLVEEPMAPRLEDALDMVHEAASQGLVLMVDYARCYSPAALAVQRSIKSGVLGEVLFVDSILAAPRRKQVRADALWALAAPDLAVLDFILPGRLAVTEVSAAGGPGEAGQDSVVHLNLRLRNSATAHLQVSCVGAARGRRMVIGGSLRTLVWEGMDSGHEGARRSAGEFGRCIRAGGPPPQGEPSGLVILSVLEAGRRSLRLENHTGAGGGGGSHE